MLESPPFSDSSHGRTRNREFSKVSGRNWLQGRRLVPWLWEFGRAVDGTVLDLGCGSSPFRSLFPRARQYIRIDRRAVDPEVIVADATHTGLSDGSVDCVLLLQMIGDVPDLVALFNEVHRVLAPGGKVLVYETTSYPQHDLPHDYWRVLPEGLRWTAAKCGFEVQSIDYLGGYFTQVATHWNSYILGPFNRVPVLRPFIRFGRTAGNLMFWGLDTIISRPILASDYTACLAKPAEPQRQ